MPKKHDISEFALTERVSIVETKLTVRESRRRTTVPYIIFKKLKMNKNTKLRWILFEDGRIYIEVVGKEWISV